MTDATAPGKLILSGEYGVLHDAPAIVMAVNRRARASVTRHDGSHSVLQTPGLAEGAWHFDVDDDGVIRWLDGTKVPGSTLLEAVALQTDFRPTSPVRVNVDTRGFFDQAGGQKLGLGSSAAATVALTAALSESRMDEEIWRMARRAHGEMQGGSGVDIAASCFGGLLGYRQSANAVPMSLNWPASLVCRVYFSGVSASTPAAIDRVRSADASQDALVAAAYEAAAAWASGESAAILESVQAFTSRLRDFDEATSAGIFAAGHAEMCKVGDKLGVVYKPSGAGGGDCGVALSTDIGKLAVFDQVASSCGFVSLDIERDNSGL